MSLTRVCVVYVVKEVASFRGLGQLMGVARNRTRARALQLRPAERKLLVAYAETGTNSWLFYLKYISKVLQGPLKVRRVDNENNNYNRLLCFRHDKVSHDY